jgi:hypothetical protein
MAGEIVRDEAHLRAPLFRHPATTFPVGAEVVAGPTDAVVFVSNGKVVGILGPGTHRLDPASVPFVASLMSQGGLAVEVWFVMTAPIAGFSAGGSLGDVIDSLTAEQINPRLAAEASVRITDPAGVVMGLQSLGAEGFAPWVGGQILARVKPEVEKVLQEGKSVLQMVTFMRELTTACLGPVGEGAAIEITQFASLNIILNDDDRKRLIAANAEIAKAGRAKRIAEIQASAPGAPQPAAAAPQTAPARRGGVAIYLGVGVVIVVLLGFGVWHAMHGHAQAASAPTQDHAKHGKR